VGNEARRAPAPAVAGSAWNARPAVRVRSGRADGLAGAIARPDGGGPGARRRPRSAAGAASRRGARRGVPRPSAAPGWVPGSPQPPPSMAPRLRSGRGVGSARPASPAEPWLAQRLRSLRSLGRVRMARRSREPRYSPRGIGAKDVARSPMARVIAAHTRCAALAAASVASPDAAAIAPPARRAGFRAAVADRSGVRRAWCAP